MIKIFADGADKTGMLSMYKNPRIDGFTTNPTLMRKAGITDYMGFAKEILQTIDDKPVSFEVFADEFEEMERQAREIATLGSNVYVKIPVTNTKKISCASLIKKLSGEGVQLNITAIFGSSWMIVRFSTSAILSVKIFLVKNRCYLNN